MKINIEELALSQKKEIAQYIKDDTLEIVNQKITVPHVRESFYTKYGKRLLDIFLSLIALMLTFPINLFIAIITFFDVGTPIIFKQQRIGKNQSPFTIYKFRNMKNTTDANGELLPSSQRVTKWGKFVRKTSLDELLNFVSILKGDMSLIGPRPLLDYYAERLNNYHKVIYQIRPGLECPSLNKEEIKYSWQERLDTYVWYAEHCSLWIDIKLCVQVLQMVIDHQSSAQRSQAGNGGFMGYDIHGNVIYSKAVPEKYVIKFLEEHNYKSLDEAIGKRYL